MVGYEAAQKIAVAKMVQRQLGLSEIPDPDADGDLAQVFGTRRDGGSACRPPSWWSAWAFTCWAQNRYSSRLPRECPRTGSRRHGRTPRLLASTRCRSSGRPADPGRHARLARRHPRGVLGLLPVSVPRCNLRTEPRFGSLASDEPTGAPMLEPTAGAGAGGHDPRRPSGGLEPSAGFAPAAATGRTPPGGGSPLRRDATAVGGAGS
jgi:hypothetical protein